MIKKICRWLYWRTHEIYLGSTPYRPDYPQIGELFRMDPAIYVVTRVALSHRTTMYQIYGVHLGQIIIDMPSCCSEIKGSFCMGIENCMDIGDCSCVAVDDRGYPIEE